MKKTLAVLLLLSLVAGLVAISPDSLWIDEGNAADKACQPTLGTWLETMKAERGSDAQMPLYMGWLWAWEKGFGHSEPMLRMANLPWILLGHAFLILALARSRFGLKVGIVYVVGAAVSPFLCYYLNEARPYAMEYCGACLILAYLLEIDTAPELALAPRLLATGVAGMLILAGGSLLGVPWAGSAFLAGCWIVWKADPGNRPKLRLAFGSIVAFGVLLAGMAVLGFYYLGTLRAGAGASSAGKTGLVSCLFAGYEIAGLAGLGPNRGELRGTGGGALGAYAVPLTAGCLVILVSVMAGALACARKTGRKLPPAWMLIALVLPLVFTIALGVVGHFRIIGRHLMPGFPFFLLWVAIALELLLATRLRGLVALFLATWTCSSAFLRFSETHQKDDYRSPSALAQNALAQGKCVWWAADVPTGRYYGLDFTGKTRLTKMMNAASEGLEVQPEPDLIVLSKRDIYDRAGALDRYIASHGFTPRITFSAFTVFEKQR